MNLIIISFALFGICLSIDVQRYVRLNSGKDCPIVALGTGGFKKGNSPSKDVVKQMVRTAIEVGYRHIDTASAYGNEKAIGQAINELINEGTIKREDLFITTKIFPNFQKGLKGRTRTSKSVRLALNKLNTSYVDLMLIHFATPDPSINRNVWFVLEEALSQKMVKSIGVSNFNETDLKRLLKKIKVMPAMVQIESYPTKSQKQLIQFCNKNGIQVSAHSPLGSADLIDNPIITSIGKRHNKTAAQVMIRWQIQRGVVAITKSIKTESIKENIDIFDINLTEEEMKELEDMK